ncbi:hypothetical protein MTP02_42830 [Streptomyces albus]|nr:hypothetical protein MTP02_42830 [Streptomyces albus]
MDGGDRSGGHPVLVRRPHRPLRHGLRPPARPPPHRGRPRTSGRLHPPPQTEPSPEAGPAPFPDPHTQTPFPHPDADPDPHTPSPEPPPADPDTGVKGYTVAGGQVVLDIGPDSADFVSATPTPGWTMQVWTREESGGAWIRVTFTQGDRSSSVFCSWNGYPPRVDIDER